MACHHFDHLKLQELPGASASYKKGCAECIKMGSTWVHLRECLICGNVACCDSSINKHATKHFHATNHPVMRSVEPGEHWGWCYIDDVMADLPR
jgi:uncharacterized UBP type Zn finger protein